jgi:Arc/MetJ-type ribon-helix-helix transcriptional regulator
VKDTIVTVRMPTTLLASLRQRTTEDHYTDLSEQVRSIVRKGCMRYTNPLTAEVKELKGQLKEELLKEREDDRTKTLLADLKQLLQHHGGEKE